MLLHTEHKCGNNWKELGEYQALTMSWVWVHVLESLGHVIRIGKNYGSSSLDGDSGEPSDRADKLLQPGPSGVVTLNSL